MTLNSSLLYSQEQASGLYPEPDKCSLPPPTVFHLDPFEYYPVISKAHQDPHVDVAFEISYMYGLITQSYRQQAEILLNSN